MFPATKVARGQKRQRTIGVSPMALPICLLQEVPHCLPCPLRGHALTLYLPNNDAWWAAPIDLFWVWQVHLRQVVVTSLYRLWLKGRFSEKDRKGHVCSFNLCLGFSRFIPTSGPKYDVVWLLRALRFTNGGRGMRDLCKLWKNFLVDCNFKHPVLLKSCKNKCKNKVHPFCAVNKKTTPWSY